MLLLRGLEPFCRLHLGLQQRSVCFEVVAQALFKTRVSGHVHLFELFLVGVDMPGVVVLLVRGEVHPMALAVGLSVVVLNLMITTLTRIY